MKSNLVESYTEDKREVFNKRFGIIFNGDDNLKPFIVENLIDSSETAFQAAEMYANFIGGAGFKSDLSHINLSDTWEKYTPEDLLDDIRESISRHQGVFIHVQYNALYQKETFKIIPYTACRVGKPDSKKFSGKIVVSNEGWGRSVRKADVDVFDVYNPRPDVIQTQVEKAGSWAKYKGQVYFFKMSKKRVYPKAFIEIVYLHATAEHNLGYFANGITTKGFNDNAIVQYSEFDDEKDEKEFLQNLKTLSGSQGTASIMAVQDSIEEGNNYEGNIRVTHLTSDKKPDRFNSVGDRSANAIRKAYKNIPPILIDYVTGKLGNSNGEDIKTWQSVYNQSTFKDRQKVERLFAELFTNFKLTITDDWEIAQYKILDDGTTSKNEIKNEPTDN